MVRSIPPRSSSIPPITRLCRSLEEDPASLTSLHLGGMAPFRPSSDFYRIRSSSDLMPLAQLAKLLQERGPETNISKVILGEGLAEGTVQLLLNKGITPLGNSLTQLEIDGSVRIPSALLAKILTECPKLETAAVWSILQISSKRALHELNQAIQDHPALQCVHLLQIYAVQQIELYEDDEDVEALLEMAATSVDDDDEEEEDFDDDWDSFMSVSSTTPNQLASSTTAKPTKSVTLCLSSLIDAFATVPQLTRLQLSSAFGSSGILGSAVAAQSLVGLIRASTRLAVLVLHNVGLGDEHAQALAKALQNQTHLYHVDLRENKNLQEASYMAFLQGLEQSNVQYLDLIPDEQKERFTRQRTELLLHDDANNHENNDATTTPHGTGFEHLVQGTNSSRGDNKDTGGDEALYNVHDWIEAHLQLNRAGRYTLLKDPQATPEEKWKVLHRLVCADDQEAQQEADENSSQHHSLDMLFLLCRSSPVEFAHLFPYESVSEKRPTFSWKRLFGK